MCAFCRTEFGRRARHQPGGRRSHVISMQILHHIDVDAEERAAYLKLSRAMRGEADENGRLPTRMALLMASCLRSAMRK
jgi:hypothetical protein